MKVRVSCSLLVLAAVVIGLAAPASAQQPAPQPQAKPAAPGAPAVQPQVKPAAPAAQPAAAAPKIVPTSYEDAVVTAANNLLSKAVLPPGDAKIQLVIDPLIDGQTGAQSPTTQRIGKRIVDLIRKSYPRFEVVPFTPENVAKKPLLLIGTFTAINTEQKGDQPRDAYRLCLALADLGSGKLVSKGVGFMTLRGIDAQPTPHFRDSPVHVRDPSIEGYVRTCQGTRVGDPINASYVDRVSTAATIATAIAAYEAKRYPQALELYRKAVTAPGGEQLRVHNGIYLASMRLNKKAEAAEAFGKIIDLGLKQERLAVMFLFNPGSSALKETRGPAAQPYGMWVQKIAERINAAKSCVEVVGHSSRAGRDEINVRLSGVRAEQVRNRLLGAAKGTPMAERLIANGVGSREVIVGTTPDGPGNMLDRRVELKVIRCT